MSTPYVLVIVHRGLDDFATQVREAVGEATRAISDEENLVDFAEDLDSTSAYGQAAVVYLGNSIGAQDEAVRIQMEGALNQQLPIVPLVRSTEPGDISDKLPSILRHLNAADWDTQRDVVLGSLLGVLGLGENERKVFISYIRQESTPLSIQLHTELTQRQFDVFLDRFTIPPGDDFHLRLDYELGDKAFMLLLESKGLRGSQWVQHEIAYAQSHRMQILAVTFPDIDESDLVSSIDEAFRVRLAPDDLTESGNLRERKLQEILHQVEILHARGLRRKREQLIGSLQDKLRTAGCSCELLDNWAVISTAPGRRPSVFMVTPRGPQPQDLYDLHLTRERAVSRYEPENGLDISAALVHDSERLYENQRNMLDWIAKPWNHGIMLLQDCALVEEDAA